MRQKLFDFVTSWLAWLLRIERCCDCGCPECDVQLFIPTTTENAFERSERLGALRDGLPDKAAFKIDPRIPDGYVYFMPPGWDDGPVSPMEGAMITNLSVSDL